MGYLHEGHLSLVRTAKKQCRAVVVSIFVNPTQFGQNEDLSTYPRDLDRDIALLESERVDITWIPAQKDLYPEGYQTWVSVEKLTIPLEGKVRPGHFKGVTTIVSKLFNVVQPQLAYFGQKDAQQAAVIRRMTLDLNFPIEIIVQPTVRESDGLAMSSRNSYLSSKERKAAAVISQALSAAIAACEQGERDADRLRNLIRQTIEAEPLASIEYVSCAHPHTLDELKVVGKTALFSVAVYIGSTRLIDNMIFGEGSTGV
jgi:pantoate--beta-alanine ligase